jgi:hypothetical protein
MEVPDFIDYRTFLGQDLGGVKKSFDPDIVVAGEYPDGNSVADCTKDPGHLRVLLPSRRGDAVLDITQKDKEIRFGSIDRPHKPFESFRAVAPDVQPVGGEICFNSEMKVSDNEKTLFPLDNQGRAIR